MKSPRCCVACTRRTHLIALLATGIESQLARRRYIRGLLALSDRELIEALAGGRFEQIEDELASSLTKPVPCSVEETAPLAVCRHDAECYPQALRLLDDLPAVIHAQGESSRLDWLAEGCVTVVGARKASNYGIEVAHSLAYELAATGVTVVSGMAFGVDAAAHRGALDAGGRTVAVLAGGADRPYPRSKKALYEEICEQGLAISEMPPGFKPRKWCFPARNRIMAALAEITVIVEARDRSGALITGEIARELGRDVGAVPGPINSKLSLGPNRLIGDGALTVTGAQDILDEIYGVKAVRPTQKVGPKSLNDEQKKVLDLVESGRRTVDEIADGSNVAGVLVALGELELMGVVGRTVEGQYAVTP